MVHRTDRTLTGGSNWRAAYSKDHDNGRANGDLLRLVCFLLFAVAVTIKGRKA